jgi:SAM-dependent methyltransferase
MATSREMSPDATTIYQRSFFEVQLPWRADYEVVANRLAHYLDFSSVLDLGCGNAFLIAGLAQLGKKVTGVDGSIHVLDCIPPELLPNVGIIDLTRPVRLGRFDLVICSEVAEHLDAQFADTLVDSICENSGGLVFFSAATVGQGGFYHVNEQPHDYWIASFHQRGFEVDHHVTEKLREDLSGTNTIWWLAKNALVFRQNGSERAGTPMLAPQAIIITCRERAQMLRKTVANFFSTDWDGSLHIQMDSAGTGDPRLRQTENTKQALKWFLDYSAAHFTLLLEDDLEFNRYLRSSLAQWYPIVDQRLHFGSLYNPNVSTIYEGNDYFVADPSGCYGSQAYLLSRDAVSILLRDWDQIVGMQDIKITRILAGAGYGLYYYKPSLVQHVGMESIWGGHFHSAPDFDRDRRPSSFYERIPGWFTYPTLYEQAVNEARDNDTLIEVGAWLGRSTSFLCQRAKASGKRIKVLVVDTFQVIPEGLPMVSEAVAAHGSVREIFERNMRLAGVGDNLEIHESCSVDAAAAVPDRSCAFVFIDADHSYDSVRNDIRAWRNKVRPGGILAGHDCFTFASVYNAVRDEFGGQFITTEENVWICRVEY